MKVQMVNVRQILLPANDGVQLAFDSCNWPPPLLWSWGKNITSESLGF